MSRLWRLDTGEHVLEIEKDFQNQSYDRLPMEIFGQVLQGSEIVENINVADNDVLLYEVQSVQQLKKNNFFAFIPKTAAEKQRSMRGEALLKKAGHLSTETVTEEQLMALPLERCLESKASRAGRTGL